MQECVCSGLLFSKQAVEQLLHGPGGVAEGVEADHAGAAFERMECTTQHSKVPNISGCAGQATQRLLTIACNLTCFFQKNVAQVIFLKVHCLALVRRLCNWWRHRRNRTCHDAGGYLWIILSDHSLCIMRGLRKLGCIGQCRVDLRCIGLQRKLFTGHARTVILNNRTHLLGQAVIAGGHAACIIGLVGSTH